MVALTIFAEPSYIVLLLKYQQVPQQLRITATTSGLRDLPPLVPLSPAVYPGLNCETQKEKPRKSPFGAPLGLPFESIYYFLYVMLLNKKVNDTIIKDFKGSFIPSAVL